MLMTNVFGAAATARLTLPELIRNKGHLLLTGSVVGRTAPPNNFYSATKWAITGMAESLRKELVGTGVRVTLVEPGKVDTPFWDTQARRPDGHGRGHRPGRPLRRQPAAPRRCQRGAGAAGGARALTFRLSREAEGRDGQSPQPILPLFPPKPSCIFPPRRAKSFVCCSGKSCRGVAQSGSAPASGVGGRRFKSSRPDQYFFICFIGFRSRTREPKQKEASGPVQVRGLSVSAFGGVYGLASECSGPGMSLRGETPGRRWASAQSKACCRFSRKIIFSGYVIMLCD